MSLEASPLPSPVIGAQWRGFVNSFVNRFLEKFNGSVIEINAGTAREELRTITRQAVRLCEVMWKYGREDPRAREEAVEAFDRAVYTSRDSLKRFPQARTRVRKKAEFESELDLLLALTRGLRDSALLVDVEENVDGLKDEP